ncbi:MAG: hypothetical protein NTV66_08230 [Methylococcales bacterium]|nr:hypothetical protein [Methylococcales bacterium]
MNIKQWLKAEYLPIPLIALMVMTRYHHFGDVLHLPDASLAVFFFAGFYRNKALLGFLLILAGLIDYLAINNGVSGWCISPAYAFLIPTYAVMWFAGSYAASFKTMTIGFFAKSVGLLTLATSIAFAISNGSFYLFSGRFEAMSLVDYFVSVAQYYPSYVGAAMIYSVAGLALVKLLKLFYELKSIDKSV